MCFDLESKIVPYKIKYFAVKQAIANAKVSVSCLIYVKFHGLLIRFLPSQVWLFQRSLQELQEQEQMQELGKNFMIIFNFLF